MDALIKWMVRRFTPSPSGNGCSVNNFSSNHPCCQMVSAAFKYVSQAAATTFSIPSVFILLRWVQNSHVGCPAEFGFQTRKLKQLLKYTFCKRFLSKFSEVCLNQAEKLTPLHRVLHCFRLKANSFASTQKSKRNFASKRRPWSFLLFS